MHEDEEFIECRGCRTSVSEDDIIEAESGLQYCVSCYEQVYLACGNCGEETRRDESYHPESCINAICEGCYGESYFYCESCGEDYNVRNQSSDSNLCTSCNEDSEGRLLHSYDYKPKPIFHRVGKSLVHNPKLYSKTLYMGVEVEVECVNESNFTPLAKELKSKINEEDAYLKSDGSLDYGIEIVTHPMTLDYHLNSFKWKKILKMCKEKGALSHNTKTCGIHVHVNKAYLSKFEVSKLGLLTHTHKALFGKIARRDSCHYSQYKSKANGLLEQTYCSDRYEAINLRNDATVEFRMFKGTLRLETLLASLEFVTACVEYVKTHNVQQIVSPKSAYIFYEFIANQKWVHLNEYMTKRKIDKMFPEIVQEDMGFEHNKWVKMQELKKEKQKRQEKERQRRMEVHYSESDPDIYHWTERPERD